jgi:transposase-like protein
MWPAKLAKPLFDYRHVGYLYRAIDKHGNPVDFLLTVKRDLDAAKRFFRKMLKDEPCWHRQRSALKVPMPSHRQSKRRLTMGFSIRTRCIMSPSIFSRASRATISG